MQAWGASKPTPIFCIRDKSGFTECNLFLVVQTHMKSIFKCISIHGKMGNSLAEVLVFTWEKNLKLLQSTS